MKTNQGARNESDSSSGKKLNDFFHRFSMKVNKGAGSVYAFFSAIFLILLWLISGPLFHFSDTWQLIINTGTTIITFLMVFVIQHSQSRDTTALQLKLDELIAASKASNRIINIENLSDDEVEKIRKYYSTLSGEASSKSFDSRHSIEESKDVVEEKVQINLSQKIKNKKTNKTKKQ